MDGLKSYSFSCFHDQHDTSRWPLTISYFQTFSTFSTCEMFYNIQNFIFFYQIKYSITIIRFTCIITQYGTVAGTVYQCFAGRKMTNNVKFDVEILLITKYFTYSSFRYFIILMICAVLIIKLPIECEYIKKFIKRKRIHFKITNLILSRF